MLGEVVTVGAVAIQKMEDKTHSMVSLVVVIIVENYQKKETLGDKLREPTGIKNQVIQTGTLNLVAPKVIGEDLKVMKEGVDTLNLNLAIQVETTLMEEDRPKLTLNLQMLPQINILQHKPKTQNAHFT